MTKRAFIDRESALAGQGYLSPGETRHLCKVLRARAGDEIELLDGVGGRFAGRIAAIDRDECEVEILGELPAGRRPPYKLTMGVSFPDRKRTSTMVRMLSELGVQGLFHLVAERSEWDVEAAKKQAERLEDIARESCKQCGRAVPMQLSPPKTFNEITNEIGFRRSVFPMIASTRETRLRVADRMQIRPDEQEKVLALVGPVGDFTDAEYDKAAELGFLSVTLGTYILRVETAAAAIAAQTLI